MKADDFRYDEQGHPERCPFCDWWHPALEKESHDIVGYGAVTHRVYHCRDCGKWLKDVTDASGGQWVNEYEEPDYDWDDPWGWE